MRVYSGSAMEINHSLNRLMLTYLFLIPFQEIPKMSILQSGEIEPVKIHYLVPGRYKVLYEFSL